MWGIQAAELHLFNFQKSVPYFSHQMSWEEAGFSRADDELNLTWEMHIKSHKRCQHLHMWFIVHSLSGSFSFQRGQLTWVEIGSFLFPLSQTSALHFCNCSFTHPLLLTSVSNQHSLPRPRYASPWRFNSQAERNYEAFCKVDGKERIPQGCCT